MESIKKLLNEYNEKHYGKRGYLSLEEYEELIKLVTGKKIKDLATSTEPVKIDTGSLIVKAFEAGFARGYRSGKRDARKRTND